MNIVRGMKVLLFPLDIKTRNSLLTIVNIYNLKKALPSFSRISVGIIVAATGVGAGDIVMASLAGARFGVVLLWAVVVGAILKYILNEGLAKWDIATGTTLLQGWISKLPKFVSFYFVLYLILWSFLVAGTLISYTGLVANTIFPLPFSDQYGVAVWGGIQSASVVVMIFLGGFPLVKNLMKGLIGLMFVVVVTCAIVVCPNWSDVFSSLVIPQLSLDGASLLFVFALIGGIGGSLTILCYSYWLREKMGGTAMSLREVQLDLKAAYFLTAIFGIAVMIVAAGVDAEEVKGYGLVTSIANELGRTLGSIGKWSFLLGFWGAVFSSMVGVWNGVPYMFADFMQQYQNRLRPERTVDIISSHNSYYRYFLLYLAFPPLLLVFFEEPNWIGIAYAVSGAFFMPFLAVLLLYMNNQKKWVGSFQNNWLTNLLLLLSILLFSVLFGVKIMDLI
ncbi:MAG: Nramp family divalent metal transporter [Bacteroidota bacterium]